MPALLRLFTIQIATIGGNLPAHAPPPPLTPETQVLAAAEIQRNDIFDPAEARDWATQLVNGLHLRTRESVVRREVLLVPGLPFDSASAEETVRNLRGLGLFRQVRLDTLTTDAGLMARVLTKDAWSTQLDFGFHSTAS